MKPNESESAEFLLQKVRDTIISNKLILPNSIVLVGVSGGRDSMCLLHILVQLAESMNFTVQVCHLNHSLRGADSDADMEFVRDYCAANRLQFNCKIVDVKEYSKEKGKGIEESARILRYDFFEEYVGNKNARIAVAHHSQDQFETVLLNLLRGAGTSGLSGMKCISGNIIRPLLKSTPAEIENYVKKFEIPYRIDATNFETCTDRNRIRLSVLPIFRENFGRNIIESVNKSAELCGIDDDCLKKVSEEIYNKFKDDDGIPCLLIAQQHTGISSRLIRALYEEAKGNCTNLSMKQVYSVIEYCSAPGSVGSLDLSDGLCAVVSGDKVRIVLASKRPVNYKFSNRVNEHSKFFIDIIVPYSEFVDELGCTIVISNVEIGENLIENKIDMDYNNSTWILPANIAIGSQLRYRRPGDRIRPHSGSGSKSVKKYLNELGVPPEKRDKLLMVARGNDILAIIGLKETFLSYKDYETPIVQIAFEYCS